ncbi:hypothetical protein PspLS_11222 [Pyricularia sp. CBS 133598]|nr:hypothetical protein PspLS_11222 [Pyricularia sp. CBS 133598]
MSVQPNLETMRGSAVYLPFILRFLYDLVVLRFYCSYIWRCPAHKLSALYSTQIEAAISRRRDANQKSCFNPPLRLLDIGVGTGYHLGNAPSLPPRSALVLADLNQNCLEAASARAAKTHKEAKIYTLMADFLEPSEDAELGLSLRRLASLEEREHPGFDIISCTFLLHCLPGPPRLKAEALTRLGSRLLAKDGVLTGATILGHGAPHNLLGRFIMMCHNFTGGIPVAMGTLKIPAEARKIYHEQILANPLIRNSLPRGIQRAAQSIVFTGTNAPTLPVNLRFAESISSLKALEASLLNLVLEMKYGVLPKKVEINTDHAQLFIMSFALWVLDPAGVNINAGTIRTAEGRAQLARYFPSWERRFTRSEAGNRYRTAVTNIYATKDDRYFHLHGSLDPEPMLDALGLPKAMECETANASRQPFQEAVGRLTANEMQTLVDKCRQAGTTCLTKEEYMSSQHGQANAHIGLFEIISHPNVTQPRTWWPGGGDARRPLAGLKVVELSRVIAAPVIGRSLAEFGASVMRITARHLPDTSGLHLDTNHGKWNACLDLRQEEDREALRELIYDADVFIQGYRPGVFDKYGFGEQHVLDLCRNRKDRGGIIYVAENCYGWHGPWVDRPGWQQISDASCGTSYEFGRALGRDEPVTPIFPNSDYSTGVAGFAGVLTALLRRAEEGGSFTVRVALNYYSRWLLSSVGGYPQHVWEDLRRRSGVPQFEHHQSMEQTIPIVFPWLLRCGIITKPDFYTEYYAKNLGKTVRIVAPVLRYPGGEVEPGFQSGTGRANPYTYEVNLGGVRTIWTADPENIKAMLGSQFEDYGRGKAFQSRWHDLLGTGIFNTDGREWHDSRHRLRPLFNRQRVSNLDSFERQIQVMINQHLDGARTVDLKDVISRFALDAIGDYAMGYQVNALADRKNDFLDALERIKTIQNIKECAGPLSWLVPTPGFKRDLKVLDDFIAPLIDQAASLPQSVLDEMDKTDRGWTYVKACASVSRDRDFLKYELMSVILAGRDTVSGTLVWTFLELVKRPDLVADLRREIESTIGIGLDARRPNHDDLRSMRLVRNTLNETLRLYPTVSLNLRTALRDTSLPRGNDHDGNKPVGLAQGTPVIFSSHILQLSPETYDQSPPGTSPPHVFDPYRWDTWKPKPWTYIPFGGGPRICIGQEFGLTEMAFLLVRLLQRYSRFEMRCEMRGNSQEGWERPSGSPSIVEQFMMEKGRVRISGDVTLSPRDKKITSTKPTMIVTISVLLATYILYWTVCLVNNVLKANATGLPVRWTPITPMNPFWIVLGKSTSRVLRAFLPSFLSDWTYFSTFDWHWLDRLSLDFEVHEKNGDTFLHATPSGLMLHTRDPQVAQQILHTCPKPDHVAKSLEVCGPNLVSSSEEDWPRHRKVTVSTLSDRNNRLVWAETVRQTLCMLRNYHAGNGKITNPEDDVRSMYLNMFSAVCFGKPLDFEKATGESDGKLPGGHERSYRYCLETSLRDIFILHTVPSWMRYLPQALVPRKIAEFFAASREMIQYLDEMIWRCQEESQDGGQELKSGDNLLRITVRSGQRSKTETQGRAYLSNEEVRGNLLIYSLAGHESNAHTLTYALYLLAAYPNVQDWLAEELAAIGLLDGQLSAEETYFGIMAKLPRTLAVMYETLRLYPSIIFLPKTTASGHVAIDLSHVKGQTKAIIPPNTNIWVNMCGMQVLPEVWGYDARKFRPSRWINSSGQLVAPSLVAGSAFVAWGGGKRVCPGQRFSQAAFAASVVTLLMGGKRIRVVPREGEGEDLARRRVLEVLDDSFVGTTVHMRRPGDVELVVE